MMFEDRGIKAVTEKHIFRFAGMVRRYTPTMIFLKNRGRTIIVANSQILLEKLTTIWTPAWTMFEDRGLKAETETFIFWFAEGVRPVPQK